MALLFHASFILAQTTRTLAGSEPPAPPPPGSLRGEPPQDFGRDARGAMPPERRVPMRRGMGPMGGPPGSGPGRPLARPWHEFDQRLLEYRRKFDENLARRDRFIEELAAEKAKYKPDAVGPASVMQHKTIDKLMGDLHGVVEDGRAGIEEAAEMLGAVLLTRNVWEPVLRRDSEAAGPDRTLAERRKAWLDAVGRLDKDGPEGFACGLLGDKFGAEIAQSLPERLRWPGPPWREGAPNPMRRQMMDNIRQNWQGRIERMEKSQEDLRRELERQERELHQMRMMLEMVFSEPETPESPPQAPAKPE